MGLGKLQKPKISTTSESEPGGQKVVILWRVLFLVMAISGLAPLQVNFKANERKTRKIEKFGFFMTMVHLVSLFYCIYLRTLFEDTSNDILAEFIDNQMVKIYDKLFYIVSILVIVAIFLSIFLRYNAITSMIHKFKKIDLILQTDMHVDARPSAKGPFIIFTVFLAAYIMYLVLILKKMYVFNKGLPSLAECIEIFAPSYYTFLIIIQYFCVVNLVKIRYNHILIFLNKQHDLIAPVSMLPTEKSTVTTSFY